MRTYPLRAVACLLFLLMFGYSFPAGAAEREPTDTLRRNHLVTSMQEIARAVDYAGEVAVARGELGMACPVDGSEFELIAGAITALLVYLVPNSEG